jgi:dynein heavy chain
VQETCHTEFASAIPILNKAVTGLQNLDKRDIDELRAFKSPPIAIKVMLKAVCLILKVEPKMIPIPSKINKFEEDYWTPAVGPHVLGSKNIT